MLLFLLFSCVWVEVVRMNKMLALALLLLIVGCGVSGEVVRSEKIKIGGLFHLTGAGAFWGESERLGASLALAERNVSYVDFIVEDCETSFPKTVTAVKKLISFDDVDFIIGPTWFGQIASGLAKDHSTVFVSPSSGLVTIPSKYYFNLWSTTDQEVKPVVDHMDFMNLSQVVVVYNQNDWAEEIKNSFVKFALNENITVVEVFAVDTYEDDYRSVVTKIKSLNVDAVFGAFAYYPPQGQFTRQAKELGLLDSVMLYATSNTETPSLLEEYPEVEGTYYPYPVVEDSSLEFSSNFEEYYSKKPSPSAAYAYDAMNLLLDAIEFGCVESECVSSYLSSVSYSGVTGDVSFENSSREEKSFEIKKVDNNAFIGFR
jgi:branched-chain amino acid transport system substrate-binding protein